MAKEVKKYLDYDGLTRYDELIRNKIKFESQRAETAEKDLSDRIDEIELSQESDLTWGELGV